MTRKPLLSLKSVAALTIFPLLFFSVAADFECEIGWTKGTHRISEEQVNDGYCDCPLDGSDEPHTNACSGSTIGSFTGVRAVSHERYVVALKVVYVVGVVSC